MMQIDFDDQLNKVSADSIDMIERLLTYAARREGIEKETELSINFVDNKEIKEINRKYRQIDQPTDVISFALEEQGEDEVAIIGSEIPVILGDIIISVDKAKEQAEQYEHSFERELGFLALHGFLHLLGYDHVDAVDEKKMFAKQEELLNDFGLSRE